MQPRGPLVGAVDNLRIVSLIIVGRGKEDVTIDPRASSDGLPLLVLLFGLGPT